MAFLICMPPGHDSADRGHGYGLACGHIGSATDDGQKFATADVHLADVHVIGVGMGSTLHNLANHNGRDVCKGMDDVIHFQTKHGQAVGKFRGASFIRNKFA